MGSYNLTCFASNQTISSRNRCRILPLLQYDAFTSTTVRRGDTEVKTMGVRGNNGYTDSFWRPMGNFIEATYDDEGHITFAWSDRTREDVLNLVRVLLADAWTAEPGDHSRRNPGFDLSLFVKEHASVFADETCPDVRSGAYDDMLEKCGAYIWNAVKQSQVFAGDRRENIPRAVQFAVIHEEAYQYLLREQGSVAQFSGELFTSPESYLRQAYARAISAITERKLTDVKLEPEQKKELQEDLRRWHIADHIKESFRSLDGLSMPLQHSREYPSLAQCLGRLAQGEITDEDFVSQVAPFIADRFVFAALQKMNLRFVPMTACDQDYSNQNGMQYARFVQAVSLEVTKGQYEHEPFEEVVFDVVSLAGAQDARKLLDKRDLAVSDFVIEERDGGYRVRFNTPHELYWVQKALAPVLEASK